MVEYHADHGDDLQCCPVRDLKSVLQQSLLTQIQHPAAPERICADIFRMS